MRATVEKKVRVKAKVKAKVGLISIVKKKIQAKCKKE